jgi:hypothetical protein
MSNTEPRNTRLTVNSEFTDAVKKLVENVNGYLFNDDGSDDRFIMRMSGDVVAILKTAREIPELKAWAVRQRRS